MTDWDKVFTDIWKYLNKEDHNPAVLSDMMNMASKQYVADGGKLENFLDYLNEYQIKSNRKWDYEVIIDEDGREIYIQGEEIPKEQIEQDTPPEQKKFRGKDAVEYYLKIDEENKHYPSKKEWEDRTYNGLFKRGVLYTIKNRTIRERNKRRF